MGVARIGRVTEGKSPGRGFGGEGRSPGKPGDGKPAAARKRD